jgi:hypothetical protein
MTDITQKQVRATMTNIAQDQNRDPQFPQGFGNLPLDAINSFSHFYRFEG